MNENIFKKNESCESHHEMCPVKDVLASIGDKWSLHTILHLGQYGKSRFNTLRKSIEGVSQRMLTVTLRSLEQDGYVSRKFYPQVPPRVEYELTDLGRSLMEQLKLLAGWASQNMEEIAEARKKYEEKATSRVEDLM